MLVWRMPHTTADIVLTGDERSALESLARTGRGRADLARRARIILRLAAGDLYSNFNESSRTIAKWKQRFLEARIAGLDGRYPGSTATVLTPQLEARILAKTREQPPDGSTQWSTRSLANALKLKTHTYVQRTWERAGLKPHRIERYMRSTDPEFETKAADVIGLVHGAAATRGGVLPRREDGDSSSGSSRSRLAALARPRRAARVRSPTARDVVAVCVAEHAERRHHRANRRPSHDGRLPHVPARGRRDAARRPRVAFHSRQSRHAQNPTGPNVPGGASPCALSLHADVLVVAQSN